MVKGDSSSSGLRPHLLRLLRVLVGIGVAAAGVLIVIGELEYLLRRCNSDAPVMEVRFWPPFAAEAIIAGGLVLAGWPRAKARTASAKPSPRRRAVQVTLSVTAILLGAVLIVLAYELAVGPCASPAMTFPSIWAVGGVVGPATLAVGVLVAVWPTPFDEEAERRLAQPPA